MNAALHPVPRLAAEAVPLRVRRSAQPLRIGFLTPHNPHDRRSFSGTVHYAAQALGARSDIELRILGPHRPPRALDRILRRTTPPITADVLAADGRDFSGLDVVLGLVATDLLNRASDLTNLPLLHVTDATPGFLREVYGWDVPAAADDAEARLLNRARPVYSSTAMAERAAREFGGLATGATAVSFGANFAVPPRGLAPVRELDRLELLFVGGDWERKGGAIALAALDRLRAAGRNAHLTLVGTIPAERAGELRARADVTVTGFLDKNRPRDAARLAELYRRAHLFVLPTRADCTPMVVAEALAYHTPVLATDIGGIGEMVGAGAGRILPREAGPGDWAASILQMTEDPNAYGMMADAAAERAAGPLCWESWAEGIAILACEAALGGAGIRAA